MKRMPATTQAASASASPAVVSWSVSASVDTPRPRARSTSCVGESTPSDTWLCVWKSTRSSALGSMGGPYDTRRMSPASAPAPDWAAIDTVCLDLDGTLLDQAYDNHIWRDLVPQRFALARSMEMHAAYAEIQRRFAERSGTLDWYCIEYWSRSLGVDIGALHREVRSHVAWLPGAREFLQRMRAAGKRLLLLTN